MPSYLAQAKMNIKHFRDLQVLLFFFCFCFFLPEKFKRMKKKRINNNIFEKESLLLLFCSPTSFCIAVAPPPLFCTLLSLINFFFGIYTFLTIIIEIYPETQYKLQKFTGSVIRQITFQIDGTFFETPLSSLFLLLSLTK